MPMQCWNPMGQKPSGLKRMPLKVICIVEISSENRGSLCTNGSPAAWQVLVRPSHPVRKVRSDYTLNLIEPFVNAVTSFPKSFNITTSSAFALITVWHFNVLAFAVDIENPINATKLKTTVNNFFIIPPFFINKAKIKPIHIVNVKFLRLNHKLCCEYWKMLLFSIISKLSYGRI